MAKFRSIDPSICQSETVAKLSYRQRDLWMRLIVTVDDQGRLPANPTLIRALVWPYDDIEVQSVAEDLQVLDRNEFIIIYDVNEKKYLQIRNWHKYQVKAEWLAESKYPAPEGWKDRWRYHGKSRQIFKSDNWDNPSFLPNQLNVQTSLLPIHLDTQHRDLPSQDDEVKEKEDEEIIIEENSNLEDDRKTEIQIISQPGQLIPPTKEQHSIWIEILNETQKQISKVFFDTYFKSIDLVGVDNEIFIFQAINRHTAQLLIDKFGNFISERLKQSFGKEVEVDFFVPGT